MLTKTFFLLIASLLLTACHSPPPASLKAIGKGNVLEVQGTDTPKLTFVTRNRAVGLFATDAFNIFRDLKRSFANELKEHPDIEIKAVTELRDNAGKVFPNQALFSLTWRNQVIQELDLEKNIGVFTEDILSKASQVHSFGLIGDQVLVSYCLADAKNTKRMQFCDKVIKGLYNK